MGTNKRYWIGSRPWNGKRWADTTSGMVIGDEYYEKLCMIHNRYVKRWNEVETKKIPLEHIHEILGAKVVAGHRRFILHWQDGENNHWILEIFYARGFSIFYPGCSCLRNPLRTTKDIQGVHLHWTGDGREEFEKWIELEAVKNENNGVWTEYKS